MATDAELDEIYRLVSDTVASNQHPITGLLPADASVADSHAWVRDNVYGALGLWALSLAHYKKAVTDEYRLRAFELKQGVVKLMRSLLIAMMKQVEKVEAFKKQPSPENALHAKYSTATGNTVVGDFEWGHLQVDATSLFLLSLAQMTAGGLSIVFTLDEVDFIQNLVFYIEAAYRTPDYGIWERGEKINQGVAELNTSSVGLAKAALVALNDMDLFGAGGSPASVIHVLSDEVQRCKAMVHSLVPRGSLSKEVDASVLMAISYPAFAVEDDQLIDSSQSRLKSLLEGRYGWKRFLRDGYKTAREDQGRLYYHPAELKQFENIECEWPIFFCFQMLDGFFRHLDDQVDKYRTLLSGVLQDCSINGNTHKLLPELYTVPEDKVDEECRNPGSQDRVATGKGVCVWIQAVYAITQLLDKGLLTPSELDPLNCRLSTAAMPDVVVQVALIAENLDIEHELHECGVPCDITTSTVVLPAQRLSKVYEQLGRNAKLKLSGRPNQSIGIIGTSKLYRYHQTMFAFVPEFLDQEQFYLCLDIEMLVDMIETELAYLRANWRVLGRPTMTLPISQRMLRSVTKHRYSGAQPLHPEYSPMRQLIEKFKSGFANGVRVLLGRLEDFTSTSCVRQLDFLEVQGHGDGLDVNRSCSTFSLDSVMHHPSNNLPASPHHEDLLQPVSPRLSRRMLPGATRRSRRDSSIFGMIRRSRQSISVDSFPASLTKDPDASFSDMSFFRKSTDPLLQIRPPSDSWKNNTHDMLDGRNGNGSESMHSTTSLIGIPEKSVPRAFISGVSNSGGLSEEELLEQLKSADSIEGQAEALHCLSTTKGADWDVPGFGEGCTVAYLMEEIYERAGQLKYWSLVRHMAGLRKKRVDELAEAAADLLVQQKQFTIGLPPASKEMTISSPLPSEELKQCIYSVYGEDFSAAVLAQELLVYLAMFVRSEPALFDSMLRLRISLIMRVMASELARKTGSSVHDASDHLISLSPAEMKALLHFILSGKEFLVEGVTDEDEAPYGNRYSIVAACYKQQPSKILQIRENVEHLTSMSGDDSQEMLENDEDEADHYRHGQWLRRRQLDGALNRVPVDFYPKVWHILDRCDGIFLDSNLLPRHPTTNEMTAGELKFALELESKLNRIPQPEYRQLMVEALMVVSIVASYDTQQLLGGHLNMDEILQNANLAFLHEQLVENGDATQCCCADGTITPGKCLATHGLCIHFYDCAPSGRYGTMSYLSQAVLQHCRRIPRQQSSASDSSGGDRPQECVTH